MIRFRPAIVLVLAFLMCSLFPLGAYGGCGYYLYQPLQFADGKVRGCVSRNELEAAFERKVEIGSKEADAYEFLIENGGERRKVENCKDYINAKKRGATAQSTFEISMESFFISTCGVLEALKSSAAPKKDYMDVKKYPILEKFPVFLLPGPMEGDVEAKLLAASSKGKSLKDYSLSKEIEIIKGDKSFKVIWDDMERNFDLVAKGDFAGDGYADLLVFTASYSRTGTFRYFEYILLTRRNHDQKMYDVRSKNEGCLYNKGRYVCSPKYSWSPSAKQHQPNR